MAPRKRDSDGLWDELTPVQKTPRYEELPMRVAMLEKVVKRIGEERIEHRKALRNLYLTLISVGVVIFLAAAGALLQMGQYMERIDATNEGVRSLQKDFADLKRRDEARQR